MYIFQCDLKFYKKHDILCVYVIFEYINASAETNIIKYCTEFIYNSENAAFKISF